MTCAHARHYLLVMLTLSLLFWAGTQFSVVNAALIALGIFLLVLVMTGIAHLALNELAFSQVKKLIENTAVATWYFGAGALLPVSPAAAVVAVLLGVTYWATGVVLDKVMRR